MFRDRSTSLREDSGSPQGPLGACCALHVPPCLPAGECEPLFWARSPPTEGRNQLFKPVLMGRAWPKAASKQAVHRHLHVVVFQVISFVLHPSASHGSVNFQGTVEEGKKAAGQRRKQHPSVESRCFSSVFLWIERSSCKSRLSFISTGHFSESCGLKVINF